MHKVSKDLCRWIDLSKVCACRGCGEKPTIKVSSTPEPNRSLVTLFCLCWGQDETGMVECPSDVLFSEIDDPVTTEVVKMLMIGWNRVNAPEADGQA